MPRLIWTPDVVLWHGGVPGLSLGDLILPAAEVGPKHQSEAWRTALALASAVTDDRAITNDRVVYVSLDRAAALEFACTHPSGKGCVYEVEPVGDLHPDPDNYDGTAWTCSRAIVRGVFPVSKKTMQKVREYGRTLDKVNRARLGMPHSLFSKVHTMDPAQLREPVREVAERVNSRLRRDGR